MQGIQGSWLKIHPNLIESRKTQRDQEQPKQEPKESKDNSKKESMRSSQRAGGWQIQQLQPILEGLHFTHMVMETLIQQLVERFMDNICLHIMLILKAETINQNTNKCMEER